MLPGNDIRQKAELGGLHTEDEPRLGREESPYNLDSSTQSRGVYALLYYAFQHASTAASPTTPFN